MAERAREPDRKEKLEAQAEAAGDTVARPGTMPSTGTAGGASTGAQTGGASGMSGAPTNDAQPQAESDKPNAEEHDPRAPG